MHRWICSCCHRNMTAKIEATAGRLLLYAVSFTLQIKKKDVQRYFGLAKSEHSAVVYFPLRLIEFFDALSCPARPTPD